MLAMRLVLMLKKPKFDIECCLKTTPGTVGSEVSGQKTVHIGLCKVTVTGPPGSMSCL